MILSTLRLNETIGKYSDAQRPEPSTQRHFRSRGRSTSDPIGGRKQMNRVSWI